MVQYTDYLTYRIAGKFGGSLIWQFGKFLQILIRRNFRLTTCSLTWPDLF